MQLIERIENNQDMLENKYALIVVGRMGHGKSSFCKMIVNDSEKYKVQAHVSIKSVTQDCEIYMSNRFNDIFGQDILVVDTPGIDSKATVSLIAEDIDDLIIKYKLQIAGIAYVIDVRDREQNQQGASHIFNFLEVLRVKHCYKINLSFCVLNKFDENYQYKDTMEDLMKQFSELFEKNGYGKMWERNIQWMSQPVKDQNLFHKKINGQLKREFDIQYPQLKHFLKTIVIKEQFLSYKAYESDRKQFEALFKDSLIKGYGQFQYQNEINQFELAIEIKQVEGKLQKVLAYTTIVGGGFGGGACLSVGCSIVSQVVIVGVAGLAGFALPIVVGLGYGSFAMARFGFNKLINRFKGSIKPNMSEQQKQQILNQRIRQKLKGFLINAVMEQAKLDRKIFTFNSLPYIDKIQSFDEKEQTIQVTKIKESDQLIYKSVLKVGKNRIKFSYKTPSKQYYEGFLREKSRLFYNNQS